MKPTPASTSISPVDHLRQIRESNLRGSPESGRMDLRNRRGGAALPSDSRRRRNRGSRACEQAEGDRPGDRPFMMQNTLRALGPSSGMKPLRLMMEAQYHGQGD